MDRAEIEATNRIRKSVGLPLLPIPGEQPAVTFKEHSSSEDSEDEPASTLETREQAGFANWKQVQDEADAKKRQEARAAAIKKARDAANRFSKLEGKGLGDTGEDDLDAKSWLRAQKSRQQKIDYERRIREEEELLEKERLAKLTYAEKDLKGVRVAHEIDQFDADGSEQVLTLKDTNIDDESADELENASLKESEELNRRLNLKKKKPVYDPNAVDDDGERKILGQYDEDIDGRKRKAFVLDGEGATIRERDSKRQSTDAVRRAQIISLDILKPVQPQSDYLEEVKIKKPKKPKKSKSTRVKNADKDDIFPVNGANDGEDTDMGVDGEPATSTKIKDLATSFVDDEDLSAILATQRRKAIKARKFKPEDLVKQIQSATAEEDDDNAEPAGLVIDETSEFVENFQKRDPLERRPMTRATESPAAAPSDDEDGDAVMQDERHSPLHEQTAAPPMTTTGLEEEATLDDQGLARTLKLLRERRLVEGDDHSHLNDVERERQRFLAEKKRREAEAEQKARLQRMSDRTSGRLEKLSNREREDYASQQNLYRSQQDARIQAEIYNREYRPSVELKYVDENGRKLNQKEAFRELSHQFHGKGSGANKTSKYLKKVEDEKRRESQTTLDASQARGMNNAMGTTQKKNKTAGVRLA